MTDVVLTVANVRHVLGIEDRLAADAAPRFFQALRVLLLARGDAIPAHAGAAGPPQSAITVRRRLPDRNEILLLIAALGVVSASAATPTAAGAVLAVMRRFGKLDPSSGELSVAEVLGGGLYTPDELFGRLSGRECPRPEARCVFLDEDLRCDISVAGVRENLGKLERRQLVRNYAMNGEDLWEFSDRRLA